jgi:hypothetical protein
MTPWRTSCWRTSAEAGPALVHPTRREILGRLSGDFKRGLAWPADTALAVGPPVKRRDAPRRRLPCPRRTPPDPQDRRRLALDRQDRHRLAAHPLDTAPRLTSQNPSLRAEGKPWGKQNLRSPGPTAGPPSYPGPKIRGRKPATRPSEGAISPREKLGLTRRIQAGRWPGLSRIPRRRRRCRPARRVCRSRRACRSSRSGGGR